MTVSDHRDLVTALLGVPGVAAAAVEPHGAGPGTLRLQLATGADEVDVAGAVNRLLRSQFGLAVDADRVRVLDGGGSRDAAPRRTPNGVPDDSAAAADPAQEAEAEFAERADAEGSSRTRRPPSRTRAPRRPGGWSSSGSSSCRPTWASRCR